ncbi:MAG: hypothetical protein Q9182_001074 [Xanthomendoza sp. 2 TL-2023]
MVDLDLARLATSKSREAALKNLASALGQRRKRTIIMTPHGPSVSCFKKPSLDKPDKPALRHDFYNGFHQVVELIKIRHATSNIGRETIDNLLQKLVEQFVVDEEPDNDATQRGRERDATLLYELREITTQITGFDKERISGPELGKMRDIILSALEGISDDEERYDKWWRSDVFKDSFHLMD